MKKYFLNVFCLIFSMVFGSIEASAPTTQNNFTPNQVSELLDDSMTVITLVTAEAVMVKEQVTKNYGGYKGVIKTITDGATIVDNIAQHLQALQKSIYLIPKESQHNLNIIGAFLTNMLQNQRYLEAVRSILKRDPTTNPKQVKRVMKSKAVNFLNVGTFMLNKLKKMHFYLPPAGDLIGMLKPDMVVLQSAEKIMQDPKASAIDQMMAKQIIEMDKNNAEVAKELSILATSENTAVNSGIKKATKELVEAQKQQEQEQAQAQAQLQQEQQVQVAQAQQEAQAQEIQLADQNQLQQDAQEQAQWQQEQQAQQAPITQAQTQAQLQQEELQAQQQQVQSEDQSIEDQVNQIESADLEDIEDGSQQQVAPEALQVNSPPLPTSPATGLSAAGELPPQKPDGNQQPLAKLAGLLQQAGDVIQSMESSAAAA